MLDVNNLGDNRLLANLGDLSNPQLAPVRYNIGCRFDTAATRYRAVERVISFMRKHFAEPISLQDMADIAVLSPYHFSRVFHSITQISPRRFLAALRLEAAKRLLLETESSVTDVCFDVGYNSLGTFTTQFTQSIGLSPRRLRYMAQNTMMSRLTLLSQYTTERLSSSTLNPSVTGHINMSSGSKQLIFVALFPTSIPQSRPVACTLLTSPGQYRIARVPDGHYYVFAAASIWSENPLSYLFTEPAAVQVGCGQCPVDVHSGQISCCVDITLREPQLTDPPILIALPFLLTERLTERSGGGLELEYGQ
jgi:AraC-like DNA-binding protein